MLMACLTSLATCALVQTCHSSQRSYYLCEPFADVVARLVPSENQDAVYAACDASIWQVKRDSLRIYPLPIEVIRHTTLDVRLPLRRIRIECRDQIEVTSSKMTIRTRLRQGHWKIRQLQLLVELTPASNNRTQVATSMTIEVNGLGSQFGWLLSDITLGRLESGLRCATARRWRIRR